MAPRTKKILHLEDDPEWSGYVRDALKGYTVYSVKNLREAAKIASHKKIDLAILDISLIPEDAKDEKGEVFLKALEGLSLLPGKRIMILSAYLSDERTRKYFKYYKVLDAIPKQKFDSKELKEMVDSAFNSENKK